MKIQLPKQCKNCNKEFKQYNSTHIYCSPCGKENVKQIHQRAALKKSRKDAILGKINGPIRNKEQEHITIGYASNLEPMLNPDFTNMFRFWIPFDSNLSKNKLFNTTRTGHVFTGKDSKRIIESITYIVKNAKIKWNINKIYLEIIVQKPTMRGDAINYLDGIADGIKKGMPLDDNWFCVRKIDWEIVKENPKIYISIMQKGVDEYPCQLCGIFQSLDNYGKSKSNKFGIDPRCKTCLSN